ncbi:MAG: GAF domain-containing protein [Yaniella sp.]|uniref:GAF domain-containing protein n=1 Tax=Yaniella sp. TaxID=2773929 RepID=UPI003F96DBA6
MKKAAYWLALGVVLYYQTAAGAGFLPSKMWLQIVLWAATAISIILLIVFEARDRGDEKDASEVLRNGLGLTSSALEEVLDAAGPARKNKFDNLCQVATSAIAGLADSKTTQAQLFWVHAHEDHKHLVSIYASNGNIAKSNNHFSSVGDEVDQAVWREAQAGRTVFHRNLGRFRIKRMPVGFTRRDVNRKYKTFITAPITIKGELLGILTINSETPFSLSIRDKNLVEVFAQQIALGSAASKASRKPRAYESIKTEARKGCTP